MNHEASSLKYRELSSAELSRIRPLWEELSAYHVTLSPPFAALRAARTFDARRQDWLTKSESGKMRIEVVSAPPETTPIAYCITSLTSAGRGEIESLFVATDRRRLGIGSELVRRALRWLSESQATSRNVVVAFGNEATLEFYRQFGFLADHISLRHF